MKKLQKCHVELVIGAAVILDLSFPVIKIMDEFIWWDLTIGLDILW